MIDELYYTVCKVTTNFWIQPQLLMQTRGFSKENNVQSKLYPKITRNQTTVLFSMQELDTPAVDMAHESSIAWAMICANRTAALIADCMSRRLPQLLPAQARVAATDSFGQVCQWLFNAAFVA